MKEESKVNHSNIKMLPNFKQSSNISASPITPKTSQYLDSPSGHFGNKIYHRDNYNYADDQLTIKR